MSNLTTYTFDQLVPEVLHIIFYYINIPDILRVRRVSRYLNEVTHSRNVWVNAYRTARVLRPPGPFLWQSARDLENMLTTSCRVSQNLQRHCGGATQRKLQTLKLREIRDVMCLDVGLIFGRFLLFAFKEEIRCYDLDLDKSDINSSTSVIYRPMGRIVRSFHCVSAFDVEGRRFACAVLNEATQTTRRISIYSLNEGEQPGLTMDLVYRSPEYGVLDVQFVNLGPRAVVIQGRLGFDLEINWLFIVVDVHTGTEFLLPPFTQATWMEAEILERRLFGDVTFPKCISTSTHLVLARSFYTGTTGWSTFFQAFMLPTSHTCSTLASVHLSPSHDAIIPGINVRLPGALLLHDAVLDSSSTQEVIIAIRVYMYGSSPPRIPISQHGILYLNTTYTPRHEEIGTITFRSLGPFGHSQMMFTHPSFNGTGRVFYKSAKQVVAAFDYDLDACSDNNDGHEHRTKVVEYPALFHVPSVRSMIDYDPYSGRICLRSDNYTLEIFDFSK